jgi:hypothetical protein
MTAISMLWLPVLLSSVLVFIVSAIIHMLTPWHKSDYPRFANEDKVLDALRPLGILPGDYLMPCAETMEVRKSPEFIEKLKKGPVLIMTIWPSGPASMGKSLLFWFLYSVVVGIFAAYVAGCALPPGASYLAVFRLAGTTAFIGYSLALWQMSIWWRRSWRITMKATIDGLLYGLLTAGVFGWLWPR